MEKKKLAVIGGGAAGFFCAVNVARLNPALEVVIIERSAKLLSKVRISGGGRCNVTHACFDIQDMVLKYPRGKNFVKKTFHQFFTVDTIEWFASRGVQLKTEADGRMFPVSNHSQTIIDCLLKEVNSLGVDILMNRNVIKLGKQHELWKLFFSNGESFDADFVCIACGGYSKSENFTWLEEMGHSIEPPVPSLFTFNIPGNLITSLMGVSVQDVTIRIAGTKHEQKGPLLITHWGLSGPAVLRLSAWAARDLQERNYTCNVIVNWIPDFHQQSLMEQFKELRETIASNKIKHSNPFRLPQRLWEFLLTESGIPDIRWGDLSTVLQNQLAKLLTSHEFSVKGKTTYKEEFVTAGGIRLSEVDANTMRSKLHPSIFFAGEILDVDGITGGFNFQHAWTSGWIAARTIAAEIPGVTIG